MNTEETNMKLTNVMTWLAAAVVVLGVSAGCQEDQEEFFKDDKGGERVTAFGDVQSANGARNDAMLYARHFEGAELNSLGRQKVLLMLQDCDNCEPVTVHLVHCGEGELLANRKQAVELYLKTADGPNTLTFRPASNDLVRFAKTESGKADASETTTDASAMGGSSASSPK